MSPVSKGKRIPIVIITIFLVCFQPVFWYHVARFFNKMYGMSSMSRENGEFTTNSDAVCIISCVLFMIGIVIACLYIIHGTLKENEWKSISELDDMTEP